MIHNKARVARLRNEAGSVILTFAISIAALFCFAVVAIDGAILMTTKNQLQSAADAAALAGASAYNIDDATVRHRAAYYASHNFAVQDTIRACIIDPNVDVVIDRNADPPYVQVTTHRTQATGDPLRTYFLKILDVASPNFNGTTRPNRVDVSARARANLVDECGARCVKPWAIPDRWLEKSNPANTKFDPGVDQYDPLATGYKAPNDVGLQITLKEGQANGTGVPGQYYPVDLPPANKGTPVTGANAYRDWIAGCAPFVIAPGDTLNLEPGNMRGPTTQGVTDLIAQDPFAYWDGTKVVSSKGFSPRIVLVPLYDPNYAPESGRNNVIVAKVGAFFIENLGPQGKVTGRFIQVTAPGEPCDNNTGASLVVGLHLIQ
jgi:Flp pilus assembly protein TadG